MGIGVGTEESESGQDIGSTLNWKDSILTVQSDFADSKRMALATAEDLLDRRRALKISKQLLKIKKPPSARVKSLRVEDIVFHTRNRVHGTKYFTTGRRPRRFRQLEKEPSPYRGRQAGDVLERVWVEEELPEQQGVVHYYPDFFTIVQGRPILRKKFKRREYVETIRSALAANITAGFLDDAILWWRNRAEVTERAASHVEKELKNVDRQFRQFLADDYAQVVQINKELGDVLAVNRRKAEELRGIQYTITEAKESIFQSRKVLLEYEKYGEMMRELSPENWRRTVLEGALKQWKLDMKEDLENGEQALKECRKYTSDQEHGDLLDTIEHLIERVKVMGPPLIYFQTPDQFHLRLKWLESSNLNWTFHVSGIQDTVCEIKEAAEKCTAFFRQELGVVEGRLNSVEEAIREEKAKAETLELSAKSILYKDLRQEISSSEVLKLEALFRDLYECCYPRRSSRGMSTLEIVKAIESRFIGLWKRLQSIPLNRVEAVRKRVLAEQTLKMKEAAKAKTRVWQMEAMTGELARAAAPPFTAVGKPIVFRSLPPPQPPTKAPGADRPSSIDREEPIPGSKQALDKRIDLYYPLASRTDIHIQKDVSNMTRTSAHPTSFTKLP
ncbi:hypothetical protein AAG570_013949 [Ranatra chinensis]|uniref:Uncharacterized protein n=1 Tax=Ranatra chinensis TaxID=642074 RepID=A0ABD0YDT7_9HEMI